MQRREDPARPTRPTVSADELKAALDRGEPVQIVDVREPDEHAEWRIPGSVNLPLGTLAATAASLDRARPVVTVCSHGMRSARAASLLGQAGFAARSLEGGMVAWNGVYDLARVAAEGCEVVQLRRVAKGCLGYVVLSEGEAVVVDATADVDASRRAAEAAGARVVAVVDTHAHADHASGGRALARATGAPYLAPDEVSPAEHRTLRGGDRVPVGAVALEAVAAPGHTPGALVLVLPQARGRDLLLTGDTLFAESVGRPDLGQDPAEAARALHGTLTATLARFADDARVLPGHHGDGVPTAPGQPVEARLGDLRATLAAFRMDADAFVRWVAAHDAPKPPNYQRIKRVNRGLDDADADDVRELEAGPNRCAV